MRAAVVLLAGALAMVPAGCAKNPVTGRSQLMLVSEGQAIAESKQAYSSMMGDLSKKGKMSQDARLTERVHNITYRLIPPAVHYRPETDAWAWEVQVIDDEKELNAWCMAGGKIAIYTGLIHKLNLTDDEIAQVMGHEIGHALAKHTAERMSVAAASDLGAVLVGATAKGNAAGRTQLAGMAAVLALQLPNNRSQESEADRIGIELAARAGYHPEAAVSLWKKMIDATGNQGSFDWLSTHPAGPKRLESLAALVPQMMPLYRSPEPRPVWSPPALGSNVREIKR